MVTVLSLDIATFDNISPSPKKSAAQNKSIKVALLMKSQGYTLVDFSHSKLDIAYLSATSYDDSNYFIACVLMQYYSAAEMFNMKETAQ